MPNGATVGCGRRADGVNTILLMPAERVAVARASEEDSLELWHLRMGHADKRAIRRMAT